MNILFSKNNNLFAIIFLMTVSLATINLFISTFKVKNAFAITAEEMLTDPILEKRAREISANLRCLVCQNQSIDDSEVELAADLRRQVRDYLVEGMTDDEIFGVLREKYGEFVLLSPPIQPTTYLLWTAPITVFIIGLFLLANFYSSKKKHEPQFSAQSKVFLELRSHKPRINKLDKIRKYAQSNQLARIMKIILPVLMLALSMVIYLNIGRPDLIDQSFSKTNKIRETAEKELLEKQNIALSEFNQAKKNVEANPNSLSSQFMLAATASQIGSIEDEINALKKALSLSEGDPIIKSQLAEALTRQSSGQVTKVASKLISETLQQNPEDIRALYLRGLELFQKGEPLKAIEHWKLTALQILPETKLADQLRYDVSRAAKLAKIEMPELSFSIFSAADRGGKQRIDRLIDIDDKIFKEQLLEFSNFSENEQLLFIKQMTKRLSEKLQMSPDNFYGWLQLANSYLSIGDNDLASEALLSANNVVNSDEQRINLIEFALISHPSPDSTKLAGRLLSMLPFKIRRSNPVKFLEGEYFRQIGDNKNAIMLWSDILENMPENTEQAIILQNYITSLKKAL